MDQAKTLNFSPATLEEKRGEFLDARPFNYCVIDHFFDENFSRKLESEFPAYESPVWHVYKNQIEDKKTLNIWNHFGESTYKAFSELCSPDFVASLSKMCGTQLYPDVGLHGGGWHIHGPGGNLNPHLDYSLHPKMGLQRKINIIIYLSENMRAEFGGHLGLWSHDSKASQPDKLLKEIEPKFNRAVIFDTTQDSWHGMSRNLLIPENVFRKSIAIYYLCDPAVGTDTRSRALFAPREDQKNDVAINELIKQRSNEKTASTVHRKK